MRLIVLALLPAALVLTQGCALLLVGGAAAGAAYGTVKYVNNNLETTQNVPLDKAWNAANGAVGDLQFVVAKTNKDATYGRLEARNAQNQPVVVELTRKSDTVTDVKITVGTFDTQENRSQARLVYDKIVARL